MGSPDFRGNKESLNIPFYTIYESLDVDDYIDNDDFIRDYLNHNSDVFDEIEQDIGTEYGDAYSIPESDMDIVREYISESDLQDFVYELVNDYYDDDVINIKSDLDNLNSKLEILKVNIVNGYNDGLGLEVECDYADDNKIYFDEIAYDFDFESEDEAKSMFNTEYKLVRDFLKHTASGVGWQPRTTGWITHNYEDDWN